MIDNTRNTRQIFDKYAEAYQEKYMNVSRYSEYLDLFIDLIKKPQARVLDAGCGPGNNLKYILQKRPDLKILGIDISEKMIALAKKDNPEAEFRRMDSRGINLLKMKFDAVFSSFCLPYLSKEETRKFIGGVSKKLNPEGVLYLSTMEDNYENSGFEASSKDPEEQLYTFYHKKEYLLKFIMENNLKLVYFFQDENEHNKAGVKDLILICSKSSK